MRGLKGWITRNERGAGLPPQTQATYDGEENTFQLGVDNIPFAPQGSNAIDAVTEAYDEPISGETAVAIASLFIVA